MHLNLYIRNCYALDLHNTNKLYYFEQELKACGFCIQPSEGERAKIDKAIKVEFNKQSQKIKDDKYDLLIQSFEDSEIILPKGIEPMKERCNLLNLSTAEHVIEYKELIEDSTILDHFFNYNALKKSYDHCEMKVRDTINRKMIAGIEKNKWFRVKNVHMLAKLCKIEESLFDIESIQMPELNEENIKLIENIKTLYNKRDSTEVAEYTLESVKQLYKFMIDSLTKRLNLYSNTKCRTRGENYNKKVLESNEETFNKYDELILIMNGPRVNTKEEEEE